MNKRVKVFLSVLLGLVGLVVIGGSLIFWTLFGPDHDDFGKKHPIPDGMEYSIPFPNNSYPTAIIDSLASDAFLQIWEGLQGGIYEYDFYYSPLPAGDIFLRCYEAMENIPLSESRIPERSSVSIDSSECFSKLVNKKEFTIYEGDWEDYYAARVEVWFRDAETKQERKLLEKIYRVEGWMR